MYDDPFRYYSNLPTFTVFVFAINCKGAENLISDYTAERYKF